MLFKREKHAGRSYMMIRLSVKCYRLPLREPEEDPDEDREGSEDELELLLEREGAE
jgi:hypothetical protein